MWTALFEAINTGFQLVRDLVTRRKSPAPEPEPIDAAAAREGTAAGAAAHDAAAHPKH